MSLFILYTSCNQSYHLVMLYVNRRLYSHLHVICMQRPTLDSAVFVLLWTTNRPQADIMKWRLYLVSTRNPVLLTKKTR
jgi:hypothetical protein